MDTWSDGQFDYFRLGDGKVVQVRRDFVREQREASEKASRERVIRFNVLIRRTIFTLFIIGVMALIILMVVSLLGGR